MGRGGNLGQRELDLLFDWRVNTGVKRWLYLFATDIFFPPSFFSSFFFFSDAWILNQPLVCRMEAIIARPLARLPARSFTPSLIQRPHALLPQLTFPDVRRLFCVKSA